MKKFVIILCLVLTMPCSVASAFSAEKVVVGISTPTDDHGWTGGIIWWAERAVEEFSRKYPDVEFIYRVAASEKEQVADVEAMLERGIKALVILPHKPAPLTTILNRAYNSGIFVVVVDRSIPKVPKDVYVAGDNYGLGLKSGKYMAEILQGKGNILVMEGMPCEGNTLRVNGFKEGLRNTPDIVVMDSQPMYWNPARGYELMRRYLKQFPKIDAIWAGDDDVLEEVLKAYQESGRSDVRFFLGGGGSKRIVRRILDHDPLVPATVTYPPKMAYDSVQLVIERLKSGKGFAREIFIPSELVTRDNAKDFYYPDSIY